MDPKQYWRIPAVALAGALLAYVGSFVSEPVYASSTQLLVRGRDATFLTNSGQTLANQPGVVDASLAGALGETQGALLGSRTVARMVVDRLDLDRAEPAKTSLLGRAKSLVTGTITRAKAYVVHGKYSEPEPLERAVAEVHGGLSAHQVKDSYVLELVAGARTPELAVAIADAAADALISVSRARFRTDAQKYRDLLAKQLERADAEQRAAGENLRAFKERNGISNVQLEIDLGVESTERLRSQLRDAEVGVVAAKAELASIDASLKGVAPLSSSESRIETGRSTTHVEQTNNSSVFDQLRLARSVAQSKLAAEQARQARLSAALAPELEPLTSTQAELRDLEVKHEVAVASFRSLSERHEAAVANSETDVVEISRVDSPTKPTYPVSPKRYLYLGLGGVMGSMAGLVLTARSFRRRGLPMFPWLDEATPVEDVTGPVLRHAPRSDTAPAATAPTVTAPAPTPTFEVFTAPLAAAPPERDLVAAGLRTSPAPAANGRFEVFEQGSPSTVPDDHRVIDLTGRKGDDEGQWGGHATDPSQPIWSRPDDGTNDNRRHEEA